MGTRTAGRHFGSRTGEDGGGSQVRKHEHRDASSIAQPIVKALSPVRVAVCIALYGVWPAAQAQQAAPADEATPSAIAEVTVTATRRTQTLEAVPYSLSVVTADQLAETGVTDIASLASQVPGLSTYEYGARFSAATVPIIRGINATGEPTRGFRTFEQAPVGTYIGNSPIEGYFQLDDLQRVEVLRGPQGTLYGAGTLAGALRLIPNSPELNHWSGLVEGSAGRLDHSDGTPYTVRGLINVPLGDTLAFRAAAKYYYEPGFVDTYGLFARTSNGLSGIPLLANSADPVTSPAIYRDQKDWNFQKTFTGRASVLWKPTDAFSAEAAILDSSSHGDGGPQVNLDFRGGPSPLDPASTLPAGGPYREFSQIDQPWSRYTNLASLDLSYDAGFATVAST